MADAPIAGGFLKALPLSAALALGACGGAEESETTYEAGAIDQSGGELIVEDADMPGVEVDLPETPMTPAPEATPAAPPTSRAGSTPPPR